MTDNIITDIQKLLRFLRGSKNKRKKSKRYKKTKSWLSDAFYK